MSGTEVSAGFPTLWKTFHGAVKILLRNNCLAESVFQDVQRLDNVEAIARVSDYRWPLRTVSTGTGYRS